MGIKEIFNKIKTAEPEPIQLITPEAVMPVSNTIQILEVIEKACDSTNSIGLIEIAEEGGELQTMKIEDAIRRITNRFINELEKRAVEVVNG